MMMVVMMILYCQTTLLPDNFIASNKVVCLLPDNFIASN